MNTAVLGLKEFRDQPRSAVCAYYKEDIQSRDLRIATVISASRKVAVGRCQGVPHVWFAIVGSALVSPPHGGRAGRREILIITRPQVASTPPAGRRLHPDSRPGHLFFPCSSHACEKKGKLFVRGDGVTSSFFLAQPRASCTCILSANK